MEEFVKAQYQAALNNTSGLPRELHKAVKNGNWHRFSTLCEFYYCLHLGDTDKIVYLESGLYLKFVQVSKAKIECYACYAHSQEEAIKTFDKIVEKVNAGGYVSKTHSVDRRDSYHDWIRGWFKPW